MDHPITRRGAIAGMGGALAATHPWTSLASDVDVAGLTRSLIFGGKDTHLEAIEALR